MSRLLRRYLLTFCDFVEKVVEPPGFRELFNFQTLLAMAPEVPGWPEVAKAIEEVRAAQASFDPVWNQLIKSVQRLRATVGADPPNTPPEQIPVVPPPAALTRPAQALSLALRLAHEVMTNPNSQPAPSHTLAMVLALEDMDGYLYP